MKFVSIADQLPEAAPGPDLEPFFGDERWAALGDMIPDGLVLVDRRGIVRYMNSAAESSYEVARLAAVGRHLSELVQQTRLDISFVLDTFARGARVTRAVTDSAGRTHVVTARCSRQPNGETNFLVIAVRNLDALASLSAGASADASDSARAFVPIGRDSGSGPEPVMAGQATLALLERGLRAIALGSRLLVLGESGVGKTELARLLHRRSGSPDRPFVHVNCGSIPESLFESEMFGYERGSFTGASTRGKKGLIEAADGGTLFLDEVGEIPLHCQAKILQMLEEGVVQRVGATAPRRLRLQVIAATNRDLRRLALEGGFRRDLYYRLSVVTLALPPLRERRELIAPLLVRFLAEVNRRRPWPLRIDAGCQKRLEAYSYPGNIRELQNLVEHLAVVCDQVATADDLPIEPLPYELAELRPEGARLPPASTAATLEAPLPEGAEDTEAAGEVDARGSAAADVFDLRVAVRQYEAQLIDAAIRRTGSKRKAAELLGVDIATIVRKSRERASGC